MKAWVIVGARGAMLDIHKYHENARISIANATDGRKVVPCTITYDDGRKPRKRRAAK